MSDVEQLEARIMALEDQNQRLRDRIEVLEGIATADGRRFMPPIEARLTGSEAKLLAALLSRKMMTKEGAMTVLYRNEAKDEAEIKIIDVLICKLRKKIAPFDITIETLWGVGYAMSAEAKAAYYALWPQERAA